MIQKAFLFFLVIFIFFGVLLFVSILGRVAGEVKTFIINKETI